MSNPQQHEILRSLFARAVDSPALDSGPSALDSPLSALDSPHPIDDEDLLLDWSLGDLSPERHEQLLNHLAACPACRREVAAMVRAGALVLPQVGESLRDAETGPRSRVSPRRGSGLGETGPRGRAWRQRIVFALITALAASLLVMFARGLFDSGPRYGATQIAMAQRDLQQGRVSEAFTRIEGFLSRTENITADDRRQASAILEASGHELQRSELAQNPHRVLDIDNRLTRRHGGSARSTNFRIQAERGETAERSLAQRMSLVEHYEFERDGRQRIKGSFPEITATHRRIKAELELATKTYPESVDLRLNYGQFLLDQSEFERAADQFDAAVRLDPANVLAHTGFGLAVLQQNRPGAAAEALQHFEAAVKLSPDDPVLNLNLAVCLMRLGRQAEAQPHFDKANVDTRPS